MRRVLFALTCLAAGWIGAGPAAAGLVAAGDLEADAELARERAVPVLVMFWAEGCPYCEIVMEDYLAPLAADPASAAKVIIRLVDVDGGHPLVDFAGNETDHEAFAAEQGVSFTPVIKFFGPGGRELAPELAGFTNEHFYGYYLDSRIQESGQRLRAVAAR